MSVTLFGVIAVSFMMLMYALESRGRRFIALFALGCVLSSVYGFPSGAWPFGVVEASGRSSLFGAGRRTTRPTAPSCVVSLQEPPQYLGYGEIDVQSTERPRPQPVR